MKTLRLSMIFFTLALLSFSTAPSGTKITWKSETIDLGEIPQNKPKAITFEFTNTGTEAVVITNVKASCGCTATNYTKSPIKPGEKAMVEATYNAAAIGAFTKTVTVTTTAETAPKILSFKGKVI